MTELVRLGQLAGIEGGVNWSVLVNLLITLGLAGGRLPALHPRQLQVLDLHGRRDVPDVGPPDL